MKQILINLYEFTAHNPYDGCWWEQQYCIEKIAVENGIAAIEYWYIGYVQDWSAAGRLPANKPRSWKHERDRLEDGYGIGCAYRIEPEEFDELLAYMEENDGFTLRTWDFENGWSNGETEIDADISGKYSKNILGALNVAAEHDIAYIKCAVCGEHQYEAAELDVYGYMGDGGIGINVDSYICFSCKDLSDEWDRAVSDIDRRASQYVHTYWRNMEEEGEVAYAYIGDATYELWISGLFDKKLWLEVDGEKIPGMEIERDVELMGEWLKVAIDWLNSAAEAAETTEEEV